MGALLARFEHFQQRHRLIALPIAVFKRFGEHNGGRLSATISYYSFFSVFPLLLAFVTILGLVLENKPDLREDLVDGALGQIPVIGTDLAQRPMGGSVIALVIGTAAALWAGLAAVGALQYALDETADVPMYERPNVVLKKLKAVVFLVVFAIGLALSTLATSITALVDIGAVVTVAGFAAAVVVNSALLLMMYFVLPSVRRPVRDLLPGAVIGGVALAGLQHLGRFVVERYISGASDTYGTFAVVIALLSWFFLVSRVVLMAAEVNEVVALDLSPRSVVPGSPLTDADRKATLLDVGRVQRDKRVGFALAVDGDAIETPVTAPAVATATTPSGTSAGHVEVAGQAADLEQALHGGARGPQGE